MGNVGSSQPKNKTGKNVVRQKIENSNKTGVLSLREHKLDAIPQEVFSLTGLRTLDVSKNNLKTLGEKLSALTILKSLNCDENKLTAGSLAPVSKLLKLENLSVGGNVLGKPVIQKDGQTRRQMFPKLPPSLKQLKLDSNYLSSVPSQICSAALAKLQKLDLSKNNLATIPAEIANLVSLTELNLDQNSIVSLPEEVGSLKKLKALSLQNNEIQVHSTNFSPQNPQPLPASLFAKTPLIDLNLHGNKMTNTQLNEFEGFSEFLNRREKVKSKNIYGGALTNLDVCGLE